MNLRAAYQRWAEQNPSEARWLPWVWTGAALIIGGVLWSLVSLRRSGRDSQPAAPAAVAPPPAPLAPGEFARQIENRYPNCPDVWMAAAQKPGIAPPDARALRLAVQLRPAPQGGSAAEAAALQRSASLMAAGEAQDAARWLESQPAAARSSPLLQARLADLDATLRQLPELKAALRTGAWGPQDPDALDLAFASIAAFDEHRTELAADLWRAGLDRTSRAAGPLAALERLASDLGMEAEAALTFDTERALYPADPALLHRLVVWASAASSAAWSNALSAWEQAEPEDANASAAALRPQGDRRL